MIAIDMTGQALPDYIEERVERREDLVLWIGHECAEWIRRDEIETRESRMHPAAPNRCRTTPRNGDPPA
jgi:hypothetical protein